MRNPDPADEQLICSTDVVIAAPAPGFPGADWVQAVQDLAARRGLLYPHDDSDVLDARHVPNYQTIEPNGPSLEQTLTALDTVFATGEVAVLAVASIWTDEEGGGIAVQSGPRLLRGRLQAWRRHGVTARSR